MALMSISNLVVAAAKPTVNNDIRLILSDDCFSRRGPDAQTCTITAQAAAGTIEALPDGSLPAQSMGRAPSGKFILACGEYDKRGDVVKPNLA